MEIKKVYVICNLLDNSYLDWYSGEDFFTKDIKSLRNGQFSSEEKATLYLKDMIEYNYLKVEGKFLEIKSILVIPDLYPF